MIKKRNNCIVIYSGLYGDSFTINGKTYCLNSFMKINGVDVPVSIIPVDKTDDKTGTI